MNISAGTLARFLAAGIGVATCLTGCATRDPNLWYVEPRGIVFFDAAARKWTVLNGSTAKFFVTQDNDLTTYANGKLVVAPGKIADAATSGEARQVDPAGDWGEPCDGFQLGLRFETNSFKTGGKVWSTLIMRNVSDRDCYFWNANSGALMHDIEFTITDGEQRTLARKDKVTGHTFADRLKRIINNGKSSQVAPGIQHKELVDLGSIFDLLPGIYTVSASRTFLARDCPDGRRVLSGSATITICP